MGILMGFPVAVLLAANFCVNKSFAPIASYISLSGVSNSLLMVEATFYVLLKGEISNISVSEFVLLSLQMSRLFHLFSYFRLKTHAV